MRLFSSIFGRLIILLGISAIAITTLGGLSTYSLDKVGKAIHSVNVFQIPVLEHVAKISEYQLLQEVKLNTAAFEIETYQTKAAEKNLLLMKKYLNLAGIENKNFAGHSLRSGFATVAAESGADERSIMAMTGHKTTQMVRRYIREANIFKNNALNKVKI